MLPFLRHIWAGAGDGSSWSPLVEDPAARFYTSNVGVTSASSATRWRAGIQSDDIMVGATYGSYRPGPDPEADAVIASGGTLACDGQGMVELPSGRLLLAGGAPAGHAYQVVNTIWCSDDRGKTWSVLAPDQEGSAAYPAPAHTFGFFTATFDSVLYVYWLGGDPFTPTGNVFRVAAAELDVGGDPETSWTLISTTCPTSALALYMYGVLAGNIYVIGGQVDILDGAAAKETWVSTDEGATWTDTTYDCPADVWGVQLGPLPVKGGKLWICGSGRYDSEDNDFSNGVFTFDGSSWVEVLEDGHEQFPASRYHSCVVDGEGRLWRFNGTTWDGETLAPDTKSAHYSTDGVTWHSLADEFALTWQNTHAQAAIATSDGIYFTDGFESANLHLLRGSTGALVSAWEDQGSAELDLTQGTDAQKPILQAGAFGSKPGLVFSKDQLLVLDAPDRGITSGSFEVWFVGKTLNLDASSEQGPDPPCTVVGMTDGSTWNNFGFNADALEYAQYAGGYQKHSRGEGYSDDAARLYGIQHVDGALKFWVDGVHVGTTQTEDVGFDADYTGWDALGAGYLEADRGAFVIGALVVRTGAAWGAEEIAKLVQFAGRYGV